MGRITPGEKDPAEAPSPDVRRGTGKEDPGEISHEVGTEGIKKPRSNFKDLHPVLEMKCEFGKNKGRIEKPTC